MVAVSPSPDVGYQEIKQWAYTQEWELIQSTRSKDYRSNDIYGKYKTIQQIAKSIYKYGDWKSDSFTGLRNCFICGYSFDQGFARSLPVKFENDPKKRNKLIRSSKNLIINGIIDHYNEHGNLNYGHTSGMLGDRFAGVLENILINEHYTNITKLNIHINKLFIQEVIPCFNDVEKLIDNILLGVVENPVTAVAEMRKKWFNHFSTIFDPYKKGGEFHYVKGQELKLCNNLKIQE